MKLPHILLLILLLLCATLAWIWVTPVPSDVPAPTGFDLRDYPEMRGASDGAKRFDLLAAPATAYALLSVLFFVGLLALGLAPDRRRHAAPALLVGTVVFMATFLLLFRSYRVYAESAEEITTFLGFPAPTAWMLFGVWGVPAVFLLLYLVKFDTLVWSEKDQSAYQDLVERYGAAADGEEH